MIEEEQSCEKCIHFPKCDLNMFEPLDCDGYACCSNFKCDKE